MAATLLTAELARNGVAVMTVAALSFVVFDSFSKRADVAGLKKELDLRQGQLLSAVVTEVERVMRPLLAAEHADFSFNDGQISMPLAIFDESTRSNLTELIRANQGRLADIRLLGRLPRQIQRLNTIVFWLIMGVAVASALCTGMLIVTQVDALKVWLLLLAPLSLVATTAAMAGVRQWKVQIAEKQVLNNSPQA